MNKVPKEVSEILQKQLEELEQLDKMEAVPMAQHVYELMHAANVLSKLEGGVTLKDVYIMYANNAHARILATRTAALASSIRLTLKYQEVILGILLAVTDAVDERGDTIFVQESSFKYGDWIHEHVERICSEGNYDEQDVINAVRAGVSSSSFVCDFPYNDAVRKVSIVRPQEK